MSVSVRISGDQEVIRSLREIPSVFLREEFEVGMAAEFSGRLYEATPPGYTGRLPRSVMYGEDGGDAVVGYSPGVEKAGKKSLDDRRRPGSRWVSVDELESVLSGEVARYADSAVIYTEEYFKRNFPDAST